MMKHPLAVGGAAGVPVARARAVGGASASQKAEEKVATVEAVGKRRSEVVCAV